MMGTHLQSYGWNNWFVSLPMSANWTEPAGSVADGVAYTITPRVGRIVNLGGLGNSRFLLGGKLPLLDTDSQFDITLGEDTEIGAEDILANNVGVAASATYDGRDNVFTPNSGQLLQFDIWGFDEVLGGDYEYWLGNLKLFVGFLSATPARCARAARGGIDFERFGAVLCLPLRRTK